MYWASHVRSLLRRVEFLEDENKQLHSEVSNLKQLVSEIKNQENTHLQNLIADSPLVQTELSNKKNLQDEMKSQQAIFEQ